MEDQWDSMQQYVDLSGRDGGQLVPMLRIRIKKATTILKVDDSGPDLDDDGKHA